MLLVAGGGDGAGTGRPRSFVSVVVSLSLLAVSDLVGSTRMHLGALYTSGEAVLGDEDVEGLLGSDPAALEGLLQSLVRDESDVT